MTINLWHPNCPKNKKASDVCLSHNCQLPPFQCRTQKCPCSQAHYRCKTMQWCSVQQQLLNWKENIGKEGREFIARVDKCFSSIKGRIEKQQRLFQDYCKDNFLGKDYRKLMYYLDKRQQKQITSQLISSAIRNLTEPTNPKTFNAFTTSQMHTIDQLTDKLLSTLNTLYHSKQSKPSDFNSFKRCSSAILQRENNCGKPIKENNRKQIKTGMDFVNLKLDLSYPKIINSKILSDGSDLNRLLERKVKKYHLAYRASQQSFNINSFYLRINKTYHHLQENANRQNKQLDPVSVILVKTEYNKVLGGFTSLKWQSIHTAEDSQEEGINPENSRHCKGGTKYKTDPYGKTALFSLNMMEKYTLNKPEEAIYCGRKSLGFGKGDLKILEKGNAIRKNYCKFPVSYNFGPRPYLNWSKSGMQLSGSRYSVFFKIVEWQAFIVEI